METSNLVEHLLLSLEEHSLPRKFSSLHIRPPSLYVSFKSNLLHVFTAIKFSGQLSLSNVKRLLKLQRNMEKSRTKPLQVLTFADTLQKRKLSLSECSGKCVRRQCDDVMFQFPAHQLHIYYIV